MLAFTHHLIIQVAAWESYPKLASRLFRSYAVLGDDVVIYDPKVAKRYHIILSEMGVTCNLSKSILSNKGLGLEFAKRTFYKGSNVSPTPLSDYYAALQSPAALFEFRKRYNLSFSQMIKAAGFGYKVLGSLNRPLYKLNYKVRLLKGMSLIHEPQAILKYISRDRFVLSRTLFKSITEEFINKQI